MSSKTKKREIKIFGEVKPGFELVKQIFTENFEELCDIGSSCCLFVKGEKVVDLWGGYAILPSKLNEATVETTTKNENNNTNNVNKNEKNVNKNNNNNNNNNNLNNNTNNVNNSEKNVNNSSTNGGKLWTSESLVNVFSCSKVLSNLCIFKLQEKKLLKITDKICDHWPNFGKNGKEKITIEMLITHQAGLPYFDDSPISAEMLKDWFFNHIIGKNEECEFTLILENQKPIWPTNHNNNNNNNNNENNENNLNNNKKNNFGYHPLTIGFYISEILIRVDPHRRGVQQFFEEEISTPLNSFILSSNLNSNLNSTFKFEFYFGFGGGELFDQTTKRMAKFYDGRIPDHLIEKYHSNFNDQTAELNEIFVDGSHATLAFQALGKFSPFRLREIEVASALGYTNARSLAYLYSSLSLSQSNFAFSNFPFPKLFQKETVKEMIEKCVEGFDQILSSKRIYSRGGFLLNEKYENCFYHKGTGGSIGLGDSKYLIGFSYTTNSLQVDSHTLRTDRLIDAVYSSLYSLYPSSKL